MRDRRNAQIGGRTAWTVPEVDMADCTIYEPLLHLLLDGEISPPERAALEAHLTVCPDCRERLAQLEALRDAFSLLDAEPPAGLGERALAAVRLEARQARRQRLRRWSQGLGALAACCVLAFLGFCLNNGPRDAALPNSAGYSGGGAYQEPPLAPADTDIPTLYRNGGASAGEEVPGMFPQSAMPVNPEEEKTALDNAELSDSGRLPDDGAAAESGDLPADGVGSVSKFCRLAVETSEAAAAEWLAENRPGEEGPFDLTEAEAEALTAYLAQRGIDLPLPWPVTLVLLTEAN